jgi:hypothetical protein
MSAQPLTVTAAMTTPPDQTYWTCSATPVDTTVPGTTIAWALDGVVVSSGPVGSATETVAVNLFGFSAGVHTVTVSTSSGQSGECFVVASGATVSGRPTVEQVALLIRARTKDSAGNEVGTFDDDTRPTADQVEEQIDAAVALVGVRFPPQGSLTDEQTGAFQALVAYRAAMRVEKSYFPEQVRTDRSAYTQLREEYLDDLQALTEAISQGGGGELASYDMAMVPVGSWTSIPYSWLWPHQLDPELEV